jgi:hypothetical protein
MKPAPVKREKIKPVEQTVARIPASRAGPLDSRFLMDKPKRLPSNYGILCHLQKITAKFIQIIPAWCL